MTIVATKDTRNAKWAQDKSTFGHRMLSKMGWEEGQGLGKNNQGMDTNLRAVRRTEETRGIGSEFDAHGSDGWEKTRDNFQSVLANLHRAHCDDKKKKKEEEKKRRKKGRKLVLAQNRVTAGHAKKMRHAKDLSKKSREDMAAIFGVKAESYLGNTATLDQPASSSLSEETEQETVLQTHEDSNDELHLVSDASSDDENNNSKKKKKRKRKERDVDAKKSKRVKRKSKK